jgi:hypothetical protein
MASLVAFLNFSLKLLLCITSNSVFPLDAMGMGEIPRVKKNSWCVDLKILEKSYFMFKSLKKVAEISAKFQ